ncbi:MAG: zinc-ribbon domain-containing protein [Terracidiphilus sp.]
MFCIHCGAPNPENASFCSACGKEIGAPATPSASAEAAPRAPGRAEESSGNATGQFAPGQFGTVQGTTGLGATGLGATGHGATGQGLPPIALPAEPAARPQPEAQFQPPSPPQAQYLPQTPAQYQPAVAGKGKPVLWVLGGFAACLLIVIAVALGSRLNQNSSGSGTARENVAPDSAPTAAPTTYTAPAPAPDPTPAPAPDTTAAPVSAPVQAAPSPAAAAPQNPIVGDWKATTFIGSTIGLHLGADGRYILNPGSDEGVYSYSSGDGTLRLQSNSFFSEGIMVWSCQVSGDTLSCVDPKGAGHVYNRMR